MSIEAMKLALEALEEATTYTSSEAWSPSMTRDCEAAAVAIRQAIEQAQKQEPVAWVVPSWLNPDTRGWQSESFEGIPVKGWVPLYTSPPPVAEPHKRQPHPDCDNGCMYVCTEGFSKPYKCETKENSNE